ncbi:protein kinase domain-containing protein [Blastococcus haudaquaticus]|uniref:non-specific serine/threonine protein kinase n=1 Tax=Blastococcus haudaquaticus TaxID=1938745 RepID=A0A286GJJ5_9ACTN|nr:protein kinase [Blastococcus haudaquaticus]SOD95715.1 serine/threonine protein kinase [Blastococcus haudaquaticus]
MVEPGRRCLGDRYELDRLIAAGGMGQVWRAQDLALQRPVAVKVLRSEYTGDPTFVARFRAEAQHAASLSHPNIAAVFDYGEETAQDGTGETLAYLVMELVEGEPLSALVAREGALGTETTLGLLRQTAFGLGEAHRAGMVHRDVKPGNILVRPDGSVKITDFGIAWSARSVALTRTGQVIGTPQYLSPEQAEGRPATPASDVYALGLIGYECLTGSPAFEGDNPVTIALKQVRQDPEPLPADLPAEVRALIGRALGKDAGTRFPDGAAFVAAIDDVQAGRPLPAAPPTASVASAAVVPPSRTPGPETQLSGSVTRPPAARQRSRVAMVLLPLLALLAGAGIAVALLQALSDGSSGSPAEAAEQRDSGSVVLDADEYIGRPLEEVVRRLTRLGLDVQPRGEARDDVVPDQVTGVAPDGEPLSPGDTVVVTYATGTESGSGPAEQPAVTGSSGGGGSTAEPTEQAVPVAGTTAPSTRSTAPVPTLAGTPTSEQPSESPTTSSPTGSGTTSAPETTAPTTTATSTSPAG